MSESKNPLHGLDGQLMITAAHRYCLGRRTYIVGACIDWLNEWWHEVGRTGRLTILRDTIRALMQNEAGDNCDAAAWKAFAEKHYAELGEIDRAWVRNALNYLELPWPLSVE